MVSQRGAELATASRRRSWIRTSFPFETVLPTCAQGQGRTVWIAGRFVIRNLAKRFVLSSILLRRFDGEIFGILRPYVFVELFTGFEMLPGLLRILSHGKLDGDAFFGFEDRGAANLRFSSEKEFPGLESCDVLLPWVSNRVL